MRQPQQIEAITEIVNNDGFVIGKVKKVGKDYFVTLPNGEIFKANTHKLAFGFFK